MAIHELDWLFAVGTIFFLLSIWALGANDVANSYATSVSSRSLTLIQAGVLAVITEFVGAVVLGQRVTGTIRHGIFSPKPFLDSPGVLIMGMVCAEVGSATWLTLCTRFGFPVSTTQSIVGGLVGVGIAADVHVNWGWKSGSVSQIAASWGIAPTIAAGFGAAIMSTIQILVHSRADPLKWALYVIPFYYALTGAILALFIVISGGHGIPSLDEFGSGTIIGIILGVFFGVLLISIVFFVPYFRAKLIKQDRRLRFYHVVMGPLLWKDNYKVPFPGKESDSLVPDYYESELKKDGEFQDSFQGEPESELANGKAESKKQEGDAANAGQDEDGHTGPHPPDASQRKVDKRRQKELEKVDKLPWAHPKRIYATIKLVTYYGITRDVIAHQSEGLEHVHRRALVYDNKVENLWTTAQVCSAMIMSVAHGANDVSNAIGPFTTEYETWRSGEASATTDTPIWIRIVGGLGLGVGFWTFGYHIMRNLGNRITKHSPTRGYSMELAAAITVLMASRLGLPVSTTQCITGGIIGVALVNRDLKSLNWKQLGKILFGWVLTVPSAGLVAGLLMAIGLNAPDWGQTYASRMM